MSDQNTQTDLLVAKMMAMETVLLTLIQPAAGNPKFWDNVGLITQAMEGNVPADNEMFRRRWEAARGYIEEWRRAMTPPGAGPGSE